MTLHIATIPIEAHRMDALVQLQRAIMAYRRSDPQIIRDIIVAGAHEAVDAWEAAIESYAADYQAMRLQFPAAEETLQ